MSEKSSKKTQSLAPSSKDEQKQSNSGFSGSKFARESDLYAILEVLKTASKREINAAFKRLMVKHHPDKNGGNRSMEFDKIRRAYDTLYNEESRRMYDEYGIIPGDDDTSFHLRCVQAICQAFANIVASVNPASLDHMDVLGMIKQQIQTERQKLVQTKKDYEDKFRAFKKAHAVMKRRLKRKQPGKDDFIMRSIEDNIANFPNTLAENEKQISLRVKMLEMVDEYEYEFEQRPLEDFGSWPDAGVQFFTFTA